MAAVVEEQGHSKTEDDTVNINQDDEFDFDIGGPEAYLDTEAGAESTNEGLTYQVDASGTLDSSYTYQEHDEGARQPLEESYGQESHDQGYGQDVFDTSEFDATARTQEYGEDKQDSHFEEEEEENVHEAETGQFEETEVQADEISYDETAGEFDGFDDTAQPGMGQAHSAMDTATSGEYAHHEEGDDEEENDEENDEEEHPEEEHPEEEHHEEEHHEEEYHEEEHHEEEHHEEEHHEEEHHEEGQLEAPADAEDEIGARVEGGSELLPEGNLSHGMGENETTIVAGLNSKGSVGDAAAHTDAEDDLPVTPQKADSVDEIMAAAAWQEDGYEDQQHDDEQPHIRVFWRTEEFRLFAESPVDDPDTYFFKGLDSLQQPLSQFLSGLRQVVDNEIATSEEVFVKVDGLGLEFGETTTTEFLERTTFGQILDLHNRLVELDDGSTSHELYLYLDARPSCLHRFNELSNGAEEGKGLSQLALYYEDASTDIPADEDEQDQLESFEDMYSDGVSISGSYNEQQEGVDEARQAEQPYNPFRVTETQLHAVEAAPFSDPAKKGGEKNASSANTLGAHDIDDEIGNADLVSGEDQDGLDLEATDILDDAAVDENLRGTTSGPDEAKNVATDLLGEGYEAAGDDEEDTMIGEVVEAEANTDVLEDNSRETYNPTDANLPLLAFSTFPMDLRVQAPATQAAGDGVGAITSSISGFWKAKDPETIITDHSSFPFKHTKANLTFKDHDAADNDDYLDLGNDDVDTTDDKLPGGVEHSGTPGPMTHDSSATATLDGNDHGNGDGAPIAQDPADASHAADFSKQPDVDLSDNELDEIDWKGDEDDEDDVADQNPTDLSPSSISAKRSRQEDKDDDGLGGESPVKRRRT